jgi:HSP20 family protein
MSNQEISTRGNDAVTNRNDQADNRAALTPPVDVFEDETGITVTADLPGVRKDDLHIRVDGDTLTLEAPVTLDDAARNVSPVYTEVRAPRYRRSFTLSRELDSANIAASLKDGVLNLRVPKLEKARPRRIEVQAA